MRPTHPAPAAPSCVPPHRSLVIDLCTPAQAADQLGVDHAGLIDLVDSGRLAAYRLDDAVRFRMREVAATAALAHDADTGVLAMDSAADELVAV